MKAVGPYSQNRRPGLGSLKRFDRRDVDCGWCHGWAVRFTSLDHRLEEGLAWLRRESGSRAAFLVKADGMNIMAGGPPAAGWVRHSRRLSEALASSGPVDSGMFQIDDGGTVFSILTLGPTAVRGFLVLVRERPLSPGLVQPLRKQVWSWICPPA